MNRQIRQAFTLMELLVVIAVIAVIAAILFPVLAQARERGRQAACLSNVHQIAMAAEMYVEDYDETFPWNPEPGGKPRSYWYPTYAGRDCAAEPVTSYVTLLQPYARSHGVFKCPSYAGFPLSAHLAYAPSLDPVLDREVGYGFNFALVASFCRPRTVSSLHSSPSEVALFGDADTPWATAGGPWASDSSTSYWAWAEPVLPQPPSLYAAGRPRHHGGLNFA